MIEAITFDFWNTLYRPTHARPLRMQRLIETAAKNGIAVDPDRLEQADRVARDEWNRVWLEDYRTLGAIEWLNILFDELNLQLPPNEFAALAQYFDRGLLESSVKPAVVDGVADTLDRLAPRYRLGIISDSGISSGQTLRAVLKHDGLLDYFAHLTFSDEIGVSKPHAQAFTTTLDRLGVEASHAVHIGDLVRTDIAGAQAMGLRTARFAAVYDDEDRSVLPDVVVHSFAEFEAWLNRIDNLS